MSAGEPALLNPAVVVGGIFLFVAGQFVEPMGPEDGPVRAAIFIEGEGVVGVLDDFAEARVVKAQRTATDAWKVAEWYTNRPHGIPDANHLIMLRL